MIIYRAKSAEREDTAVSGDTLTVDPETKKLYIEDSTFRTSEEIIPETLTREVIEQDEKGRVVYMGEEKEDPHKINITAREDIQNRFDIPPVEQDLYNDIHDLGHRPNKLFAGEHDPLEGIDED